MKRLIVMSVSLFALTAACSGGSNGNESTGAIPDTPPASPTPSSPTPIVAPPETASKVIRAIHKLNAHAHLTVIYTARTDPNDLLGRPGNYVSKSAFIDDRVRPSDIYDATKGSIDHGGGVEYFATHNLAMKRAHYLQRLSGNGAFGTSEYDYVDGGVLLRVTFNLIPRQAKQYRKALATVMGAPALPVTK